VAVAVAVSPREGLRTIQGVSNRNGSDGLIRGASANQLQRILGEPIECTLETSEVNRARVGRAQGCPA
jgi:hypothetical protein